MASIAQSTSVPQGFSVYQPTIGAPLQFFPELGSQQLDDLINSFIPGPSPASEKRATITLDFLEHTHVTGQSFKFYPVYSAPSTAASSSSSPSMDSVSSSFNVSPLTTSWDWSATNATPSVASSSRSVQRRRASKTSSPPSRHQTTDFSHLPGMKILTKDGMDVTNAASRGSKTKEQRDHAHLMRIIKACDTCKRKKIRCDPSHKKRGVAQTQQQTTTKPAKKARTTASQDPPPASTESALALTPSFIDLDSSFSFASLENLESFSLPYDPLEEFLQFPTAEEDDFSFLLNANTGDGQMTSQSTSSSSSSSPFKPPTPLLQDDSYAPPGSELVQPGLLSASSNFPFLEGSLSSTDYTDFNLFSPQSSFSEDERMLPIGSSMNSSLPSPNEPSVSQDPSPAPYAGLDSNDAFDWDSPGLLVEDTQHQSVSGESSTNGSFHDLNNSGNNANRGGVARMGQSTTGGDQINVYWSSRNTDTGSGQLARVVMSHPPGGTSDLTGFDDSVGNQAMNHTSTGLASSSKSSRLLNNHAIEALDSPEGHSLAEVTSNVLKRISQNQSALEVSCQPSDIAPSGHNLELSGANSDQNAGALNQSGSSQSRSDALMNATSGSRASSLSGLSPESTNRGTVGDVLQIDRDGPGVEAVSSRSLSMIDRPGQGIPTLSLDASNEQRLQSSQRGANSSSTSAQGIRHTSLRSTNSAIDVPSLGMNSQHIDVNRGWSPSREGSSSSTMDLASTSSCHSAVTSGNAAINTSIGVSSQRELTSYGNDAVSIYGQLAGSFAAMSHLALYVLTTTMAATGAGYPSTINQHKSSDAALHRVVPQRSTSRQLMKVPARPIIYAI